jgi:hypothetical protein
MLLGRPAILTAGTLGRILYFAFRLRKYSAEITVSAEYSAGVSVWASDLLSGWKFAMTL